jgi:hypothetical protein
MDGGMRRRRQRLRLGIVSRFTKCEGRSQTIFSPFLKVVQGDYKGCAEGIAFCQGFGGS